MKSDLNTEILKPEEIINWVEPETEDEKVLFEAFKQALKEYEELRDEIRGEFSAEIDDLNIQVSALEKDREEHLGQIENLETQLEQTQEELKNWKEENNSLEQEISNLERELQQIDQQNIN